MSNRPRRWVRHPTIFTTKRWAMHWARRFSHDNDGAPAKVRRVRGGWAVYLLVG